MIFDMPERDGCDSVAIGMAHTGDKEAAGHVREGFWDGSCVHHPPGAVTSKVTSPLGHKMTASSNGSHQVFSSGQLASLAMYPCLDHSQESGDC